MGNEALSEKELEFGKYLILCVLRICICKMAEGERYIDSNDNVLSR